MVILLVIEWLVVFILIVLVITQMVLPPFIGKRFFWLFRKSEKRISEKRNKLSEVEDAEKEVNLEMEINKRKEELKKKMTEEKK